MKIAVTGPESTGKSMLSRQLAEHYGTCWVPEYAREYLDGLERGYRYEDIARIARGQLALEDQREEFAKDLLICDTDLLVTYIWSLFKYGKCDPWIEERMEQSRYSLHLLCDIDLPWSPDPLREHPDKRKELFDLYLQELEERDKPYRIIRGEGKSRLLNAISAIESFFTF